MPELLILDVVCARPEAGSIEAGIRSVVSYDAYTRERGPVSTDDDIRLKALALIRRELLQPVQGLFHLLAALRSQLR